MKFPNTKKLRNFIHYDYQAFAHLSFKERLKAFLTMFFSVLRLYFLRISHTGRLKLNPIRIPGSSC
ncbi:MAG: hypothetical protein P8184_17000 [Calditrichia bacterium]